MIKRLSSFFFSGGADDNAEKPVILVPKKKKKKAKIVRPPSSNDEIPPTTTTTTTTTASAAAAPPQPNFFDLHLSRNQDHYLSNMTLQQLQGEMTLLGMNPAGLTQDQLIHRIAAAAASTAPPSSQLEQVKLRLKELEANGDALRQAQYEQITSLLRSRIIVDENVENDRLFQSATAKKRTRLNFDLSPTQVTQQHQPPKSVIKPLKRTRFLDQEEEEDQALPNADEVAKRILSSLATPKVDASSTSASLFTPNPRSGTFKVFKSAAPSDEDIPSLSKDLIPSRRPLQEMSTPVNPSPTIASTTTTTTSVFKFSPGHRLKQTRDVVTHPFNFEEEETWICATCQGKTSQSFQHCSACFAPKLGQSSPVPVAVHVPPPSAPLVATAPSVQSAAAAPVVGDLFGRFALKNGEWRCTACSAKNFASHVICPCCEAERPPVPATGGGDKGIAFASTQENYVFSNSAAVKQMPETPTVFTKPKVSVAPTVVDNLVLPPPEVQGNNMFEAKEGEKPTFSFSQTLSTSTLFGNSSSSVALFGGETSAAAPLALFGAETSAAPSTLFGGAAAPVSLFGATPSEMPSAVTPDVSAAPLLPSGGGPAATSAPPILFGGGTNGALPSTSSGLVPSVPAPSTLFGGGVAAPPLFGVVTAPEALPSASATLFGGAQPSAPSTSLFGGVPAVAADVAPSAPPPSLFGAGSSSSSSSSALFGGPGTAPTPVLPSFTLFGGTTAPSSTAPTPPNGASPPPPPSFLGFGATTAPALSTTGFGTAAAPSTVFGASTTGTAAPPLFGASTTGTAAAPLFGASTAAAAPSLQFGAPSASSSSTAFGANNNAAPSIVFGSTTTPFGNSSSNTAPMFGNTTTAPAPMFGNPPATSTPAPMFGNNPTPAPMFGNNNPNTMFGNNPTTTAPPMFGNNNNNNGMFGGGASSNTFGGGAPSPSFGFPSGGAPGFGQAPFGNAPDRPDTPTSFSLGASVKKKRAATRPSQKRAQ